MPSGVLYHPPPPVHWQGCSITRWKQQAVAHLRDKVVCIPPLLLYLYTSQVIGLSSYKMTS